jgi:hypothetical protein
VMRMWKSFLIAAGLLVLLAPEGGTQTLGSSIGGVVKDSTGGVLPGVTVEISSPALIGGVRTLVTDATGQYRVVDLRPGTYTITCALPGFQTVRMENVVLRASFAATVNIDMSTAAVQETVTVSGASPVVDVKTNVSERSIDQTLLEEVPTSRGIFAVAALVPGMTTNIPDVGGSETHQLTRLSVHGSEDRDVSFNSDGLDITGNNGNGGIGVTYYNQALQEEVSVQSKALPAEIGGGGIYLNMVSKDGGNQFKGSMFLSYTGEALQSNNVSDEQRELGMTDPARVDSLLDFNPTFGGPLIRDRLWFIGSYRYWRNNRFEANTYNPDRSQALDRQLLVNYSGKVSAQLNNANRLGFVIDWNKKYREERRDRTTLYQFISPEASKWQRQGGPIGNARWTSTLRDDFLLEAGFSFNRISWFTWAQPSVDPLALPRLDLQQSLLEGRAETELDRDIPQNRTLSAFSTWFPKWHGAHTLRFGVQYNNAPYFNRNKTGGLDLTARFRNGVPDSVTVWNTPVENRIRIEDLGLFVQDSWTIKNRLTLNIGTRFERYVGSIDPQTAPAGVFVPERRFDKVDDVPNWSTIVPRMAFVYDLTGKGRTAIKANASKYMQKQGASFMNQVNPLRLNSEVRTWIDANGDRYPQLTEIGPGRGELDRGASVRLAPDLDRPYQWEYTATLEHQLTQQIGVTVSYFRRKYYDVYQAVNQALTDDDWLPVTVANPIDGSPFTIYNQTLASVGRFDNVVKNFDDLGSNYNGFEVSFDRRMADNFSLFGGYTLGKHQECTSASTNPNDRINSCGYHLFDSTHIANLSGLYRLPRDVMFSGHFQYKTGQPLRRDFTFTRAQGPNLTQVNQRVLLTAAGEPARKEAITLLDFRVSKRFRLGANTSFEPTFDIYNVLNENAALSEVETVGPALGRISRNVDGRTVRFGFRVLF